MFGKGATMSKQKITIGRGGSVSVGRDSGGLNKRKIAIGVVSILLVSGSLWAWIRSRPDAQVEKIKQLQAEAFKEGTTTQQRQASFELIRQEREKLSPAQRREVGQAMRQTFERQADKRMATYFTLPQAQRTAYLDQQIKEMEQRRKEMQARRGQGGGQGGGGPQGFGGQGSGGGANNSDARAIRRDQRLDGTTATQRAMRSAFMADMQLRRTQLGLPPMGGGGRGR
jgi:hypothetical protein